MKEFYHTSIGFSFMMAHIVYELNYGDSNTQEVNLHQYAHRILNLVRDECKIKCSDEYIIDEELANRIIMQMFLHPPYSDPNSDPHYHKWMDSLRHSTKLAISSPSHSYCKCGESITKYINTSRANMTGSIEGIDKRIRDTALYYNLISNISNVINVGTDKECAIADNKRKRTIKFHLNNFSLFGIASLGINSVCSRAFYKVKEINGNHNDLFSEVFYGIIKLNYLNYYIALSSLGVDDDRIDTLITKDSKIKASFKRAEKIISMQAKSVLIKKGIEDGNAGALKSFIYEVGSNSAIADIVLGRESETVLNDAPRERIVIDNVDFSVGASLDSVKLDREILGEV